MFRWSRLMFRLVKALRSTKRGKGLVLKSAAKIIFVLFRDAVFSSSS